MNVSLAPPQRKGAVKFSLTIVLQDQTKLSLEAGNPTTLITVRGTKICQTINVFATNIQSIIGESFISFM